MQHSHILLCIKDYFCGSTPPYAHTPTRTHHIPPQPCVAFGSLEVRTIIHPKA